MQSDPLSATFAALADPTRRAILARLAAGETSVKALAEPFQISAPAVTKHLKVLERAGLIARSRDAQRRPCHLQPQPLREVADWVEAYRRLWEQRLDRLEAYLQQLHDELPAAAPPAPVAPAPARTPRRRARRSTKPVQGDPP